MSLHPNELNMPISALQDPEAREMLRAWVVDKGLQCSLNVGLWADDEATVWGILLSDVARHVADALKKQHGVRQTEILGKIRKAFVREMDAPTADTSGGFVDLS